METLRTIILAVLLLGSVLLIAVILMQQSKDAGLGAAFGGSSDESTISAKGRQAGKEAKLKKLTVILAVAIGVFALILTALPAGGVI